MPSVTYHCPSYGLAIWPNDLKFLESHTHSLRKLQPNPIMKETNLYSSALTYHLT